MTSSLKKCEVFIETNCGHFPTRWLSDPTSGSSHPRIVSSTWYRGASGWWTDSSRSNGRLHQTLGNERLQLPSWDLSEPLALEETKCQVRRTFRKWPRSQCGWPNQKLEKKWVLLIIPPSDGADPPALGARLGDSLTATLWEILSQNLNLAWIPAAQELWDNTYVLSEAIKFGIICYAAIEC